MSNRKFVTIDKHLTIICRRLLVVAAIAIATVTAHAHATRARARVCVCVCSLKFGCVQLRVAGITFAFQSVWSLDVTALPVTTTTTANSSHNHNNKHTHIHTATSIHLFDSLSLLRQLQHYAR